VHLSKIIDDQLASQVTQQIGIQAG